MRQTLLRAWVLLAIAHSGAALAACQNSTVLTVSELQGKWVLESIGGHAIESETDMYFKIDGLTISGFDGCNLFGGLLDKPKELRIGQRACPSDSPRLPLQLSDPRAQLESSELDGDTLDLVLADEAGKATFRRQRED